jgi:undecaprenyl-diphosphatase
MLSSRVSIALRIMKPAARMPELRILIALFLAVGTLWVFEEVHENFVREGEKSMDSDLLLALRSGSDQTDPIGPEWVEELARDLTALGGVGVLTLVIAASVLFLFMAGQARMARMVLVATTGGIAITQLLKAVFDRARPDLLLHETHAYTSSFPSGHSAMSAITYLTLGALVARGLPTRTLKAYVMLVSAVVTLLVGFSRVYLGVHWPSDVLGGWSLGAGWSLLCWAGAEWLEGSSARTLQDPPGSR